MIIATTLPQDLIDQFVGSAHGDFQTVKTLIEKYPDLLHANASWNEHAIEAATQTGQVQIVEYLLERGAVMDICTAAMLNDSDQVETLLTADPTLVNARGAHGIPLLYFPTIRANKAMAAYLFQKGASINNVSPGGITALHGAVMFDQVDMAGWLLGKGADPNLLYDGKTPLRMAIEKQQQAMVNLLRDHGGRE